MEIEMKYRMSSTEMMESLQKEKINTWFDLGLFIDRVRDNTPVPSVNFQGNYMELIKTVAGSGIAFITFYYSVDGVTVEVSKYAKTFRKMFNNPDLHFISGTFYPEAKKILPDNIFVHEIEEMQGFDDWNLYKDFFFTKLERGSASYNNLITKYWDQVKTLCNKLGNYIEENNIKFLYLINSNSNPGNVSLALANVLVSEYMGIPVINNNHDFYWEGGNKQVDIDQNKAKKGPRDFFFLNSHLGEVFTLIETLYPWQSRTWMHVNINRRQSSHLIDINGINPANISEIGTAIDLDDYNVRSKRSKINAFLQFEKIFSNYQETLISYSVKDVLSTELVNDENPRPILIGNKTKAIHKFLAENIIFLQPTRIIGRKRIEIAFKMIIKLLNNKYFREKFKSTEHFKLTVLISGPIPLGQRIYFYKLLERFSSMLEKLDDYCKNKIFLGFLFSELDKNRFKKQFNDPISIPELYKISSLILLPSKTEGRGLPILEAAASGVPILCRRYYPQYVYSEVIGEHLPEKLRLNVIEFDGKKISSEHIRKIVDRVLFPHKFMDEIRHNYNVIYKRYSFDSLKSNFEDIFQSINYQINKDNEIETILKQSFEEYNKIISDGKKYLGDLIHDRNRHFLPGTGRLKFMQYLKSLIDPSFFRVEEQNIRGVSMNFAKKIAELRIEQGDFSKEKILKFYNIIDAVFRYSNGDNKLKHDHSYSYRHRNNKYFPFQDYTIQELTGLVNLIFHKIFPEEIEISIEQSSHFFTDWNLALSQLTSSLNLEIDNRKSLIQKMKQNIPIAYFPGRFVKYGLEFFALQSVRGRLSLSIEDELTEEIIKDNATKIAPIYVFANKTSLAKWPTAKSIEKFINHNDDKELALLNKYGILRIVTTHQLSIGIHFAQLGKEAIDVLDSIRKSGGYIISTRRNSTLMTDFVNIDRFHIGHIDTEIASNIMGIPLKSGYIQFVPAGIRTTLAFPTPIQTAYDFYKAIESEQFKKLSEKHGKQKLFDILKEDAEQNGSPIKMVLDNLEKNDSEAKAVEYKYVNGVYKDGNPWNGVLAKVNISNSDKRWQFIALSADQGTKRVTSFVEEFNKFGGGAEIAWNGGYILNPELVGKLGLPESYIGSPLGLMISDREVLSTPLFNKPAFIVNDNGSIDIKRVSVSNGLIISCKTRRIEFPASNYNLDDALEKLPDFVYYDLMYDKEQIEGNGRVIVRLAGNRIKEVIFTTRGEKVKIMPVGLTLSIADEAFPGTWDMVDKELKIEISGLENVEQAVEAGPLLIDNGTECIDMKVEGWKTNNSIRTQAARLDYLDMRGPKIAIGIDKQSDLYVLTINGRIRESVGATHTDMANILQEFGMEKAMGFDPGGSATLVVGDKTMNVSPYNSRYEENIYSLPPEPRAVANAIIGFRED